MGGALRGPLCRREGLGLRRPAFERIGDIPEVELRSAIEHGFHMNLDNEQEIRQGIKIIINL